MFRRPSDGVKKPGFCGHTLKRACNNALQRAAPGIAGANVFGRQCSGTELATRSQ